MAKPQRLTAKGSEMLKMKITRCCLSWIAIVFCFYAASANGSEWKDKGEAEGKVTWYASLGATDARRIIDRFKELYPKIDAQFYRAGHKDPEATWTSIYTNYTVLGYNSRSVARENVPKSHADLLKPVWRGQVGIVQTGYEWFAVMLQGMGQEKGMAFMRALAKQQPQLRNGRTLLAQLVAAGEVNSALAAYSQNFENLKRDGAPVDWVPLDPVYGNLNPMGLSVRAPHPSAGKLFIDFVLSKAGQETIRAQRRVPDRIDVLPDPPKLAQGFTPVFTADEVYANFDRYVKLFQDTFGSK